jgi:hypothetical protein
MPASAATRYYSRDGNGTQDGLSYANRGSTPWSVYANPGDTIYFCGTFLATDADFHVIYIRSSGTAGNPITIRMDYPGDPGVFYGVTPLSSQEGTWSGPDGNGYYAYSYAPPGIVVVSPGQAGVELLPTRTAMSASDLNGYCSDAKHTYVKLSGGRDPRKSENPVYYGGSGAYYFSLSMGGAHSYITFKNCTSYYELLLTGAGHHITFDGCAEHYPVVGHRLFAGQDYWTWINCEIDHCDDGIYSIRNLKDPSGPGANYGTVIGGHISYTGDLAGPWASLKWNSDAHGIGLQNSTGWVIDGVEIDHTCSAIELFGGASQGNYDHTVRNCIIHDTLKAAGQTNAGGITIYAGPAYIHNNVLWNIAGTALACATPEPVVVENNSLYNVGIDPPWGGAGITFLTGTCRNNIIQGCKYFIKYGDPQGQGRTAAATIDYNLYSGQAANADFYCQGNETLAQWQARGYDTHSRTGAPGWSKAAPSAQADFRLLISSQAIISGASVSYKDPDGKVIWKTMGAYAAPSPVLGAKAASITPATQGALPRFPVISVLKK